MPLDTQADGDRYSLCPIFKNAFIQGRAEPLENLECFKGNCPSKGNDLVVCPSGFWGFRHGLGMPPSVSQALDVAPEIIYQQQLRWAVGVSTDLGLWQAHERALQSLRPDPGWNYADSRDRVFTILKDSKPHLVYFYCHGGLNRGLPYLRVGSKNNPGLIDRSNFRAKGIVWEEPRPLVFINGCHTTALEPEQALDFVSPLISFSRSAGVIGTEITIFEPLATDFAEECLRRFISGASIGEAIRGARLALLQNGNPLGLVYIPFVHAGLRLVDQSPAPPKRT